MNQKGSGRLTTSFQLNQLDSNHDFCLNFFKSNNKSHLKGETCHDSWIINYKIFLDSN